VSSWVSANVCLYMVSKLIPLTQSLDREDMDAEDVPQVDAQGSKQGPINYWCLGAKRTYVQNC
jgi:hypothetical protein